MKKQFVLEAEKKVHRLLEKRFCKPEFRDWKGSKMKFTGNEKGTGKVGAPREAQKSIGCS